MEKAITPILTSKTPRPLGPYSQGLLLDRLLFVSGQVPVDPGTGEVVPGDVEAQTDQVMRNLLGVLNAAGMGPEHLVRTTLYLADMEDYERVNRVYARYLGSTPPTRSTIQAGRLVRDVRVFIDAIAFK